MREILNSGSGRDREDEKIVVMKWMIAVDEVFADLSVLIKNNKVGEKLEGQVDLSIKKERLKRLIALQNEIGTKRAESYIGKTLEVLVTDKHPKKKGYLLGNTFTNKNVNFIGSENLIGEFVKVKIISSKLTVLTGTLVEE